MAALAIVALLIGVLSCWPSLRAAGKRRKALKSQALQLPERHRPRCQKSLAWDPLAFPLAMSSSYALCRDSDTARSFWRAQPDSAPDGAHDAHRTQVFTGDEGLLRRWLSPHRYRPRPARGLEIFGSELAVAMLGHYSR
ncbi:MAG: hypothetical protein ACTIK1_12755 [Glutamicibacter arilaitensis]|uniref:hypothetical protein n=1 Tax=Glutamicibacter arilaitensis TaxID=256701 RepID=UPI003FCFF363